jgi:hypothetical protein
VTDTFGIIEEATAGTESDRFVDVITLIFMTSIRSLSRGVTGDAYVVSEIFLNNLLG